MLVCSISQRPPRRTIAADVAEAVAAADELGTGNIVFATLVDDPGDARDTVDAYSGEIMLEAASADAVVDAGLAYAAAIDESTVAADLVDGTTTVSAVTAQRTLSASRPGLGSVVVGDDGGGKTRLISNIAVVS